MPTSIVALQRPQDDEPDEQLLDEIQSGIPSAKRVRCNEHGSAPLNSSQLIDDARRELSDRPASADENWAKHIFII